MIAGGVLALSVVGGMVYQNHEIHHYHTMYDNLKVSDGKAIQMRDDTIAQLLNSQKSQTTTTTKNVATVVTVPGPVKTIVKTVHDAPLPANCGTPPIDEEAKNAF